MFIIGCGWSRFFIVDSINFKFLLSKCIYKVNIEFYKFLIVVDVLLCRIYNESVKLFVDGYL